MAKELGSYRERRQAMRALIQKDAPLALTVSPHHELSAQELERGGHGWIQILDQRNWIPVIAPHERLAALPLLLLLLLASVLLQRRLHAHAELALLLGRVGVHRRPRRGRDGRHCGRLRADSPMPGVQPQPPGLRALHEGGACRGITGRREGSLHTRAHPQRRRCRCSHGCHSSGKSQHETPTLQNFHKKRTNALVLTNRLLAIEENLTKV